MEVNLINSETNEVIFTGKALSASNIEQSSKKRYKVLIKTIDGQEFTRYTNYIDRDDSKNEIHIEGMVIKECELKNVDDTYIE